MKTFYECNKVLPNLDFSQCVLQLGKLTPQKIMEVPSSASTVVFQNGLNSQHKILFLSKWRRPVGVKFQTWLVFMSSEFSMEFM